MIAAGIIDAMIAAGASADVIAAAWKADLAQHEAKVEARRAKDAERQRRHRESRDVTVTGCDETLPPFPPTPPLKFSPDPFQITPPIPPKPTNDLKRAKRLSDEWMPAEPTGKAVAMIDRWQSGELERELAKFRNYWIGKAGKDACKTDWQRTWINWLIAADERKPRNGGQHSGLGKSAAAAVRAFGDPASWAEQSF